MGILQALLKEVRAIDTHPGVKGFLQDPPSPDPVSSAAYIILDGATGVWIGHDDEVARWDTITENWTFDDFSAANTHVARVEDPGGIWYYNASTSEWVQLTLIGGLLHFLSNAPPVDPIFGTASAGSSSQGSRSDHVHNLGTPAIPAPLGAIASAGSGSSPSKDDHVHPITTGASQTVGQANDQGSGTAIALANHIHAHGSQLKDGSAHTNATNSMNGFMSSTDKSKLNAMPPFGASVFWGNSDQGMRYSGFVNMAESVEHYGEQYFKMIAGQPHIMDCEVTGLYRIDIQVTMQVDVLNNLPVEYRLGGLTSYVIPRVLRTATSLTMSRTIQLASTDSVILSMWTGNNDVLVTTLGGRAKTNTTITRLS